MKHALCASAISLVALVTAAAAVAVPPSPGATYRGKTSGQRYRSEPIPVELKVAADGKSLTFSIRCQDEGRRWIFSLKGVKVNAQGGFSKTGKSQGVTLKVSGKFASATKASGKLDTGLCWSGDATFTARR
jgi:hypothetical protein